MIEIIPAIDIIEGKCVRLIQGDYLRKSVYNENPLEVAKMFEGAGLSRLHLVDLDGAKAGHIVNEKVLEKIASRTNLTIDFGGGMKSDEDLRIAFESGAAMVTGGSVAVKSPALLLSWLSQFGCDKIILGADAIDRKIAIAGWQESTEMDVSDYISGWCEKGITKVISTDIGCDGMMEGPSIELYKDIMSRVDDIYLVASGGVASMDDIVELEMVGVPAVITGKALYENAITLNEIQKFIA